MTTFINSKGLPTPVLQLCETINSAYDKGECDISTTELIGEPLQRILKREYAEELVEDIADYQHRMIGSVLHDALCMMDGDKDSYSEQRLFIDVGGWIVSGEPDYYIKLKSNKLIDYKYTAKYKTKDGVPEEWQKQINIYAHMLIQHNKPVDVMQFCVWYRDAYAKRGDALVELIECPAYTQEQIADYLLKRVKYHQVSDPDWNELIDLDCVPECSEKARYHVPKKFALMKTGRKSAIKLYDSREDAEANKEKNGGKGFYIQERDETNDMCTTYCIVAEHCQYEQARRGDEKT